MKSVALHNLGCKVNSYEMDVMQQRLQDRGYKIVPFDAAADIYIINTCTVTNIADRKSRQILHRARQLNPDAVVVAVGCYVQTGMANIEKDDGIDLAIGNNHKKDIAELLERYLEERRKRRAHRGGSDPKRWGAPPLRIWAEAANMRKCSCGSLRSIPGRISRFRTDATSFAPTA